MSTSNDQPQPAVDLGAQAREAVRKVGSHLNEQANAIRDVTASARYNTQDFIQNNPWQSVALAAGVGFLIGLIVARR
jgi:ElaB/YqjD/DUF883 family membrane-anchored ribosome-binding protein